MKKNTKKVNLISVKFSNHYSFSQEQKVFFTQDTKYSSTENNWNVIERGKNKILPVTIFYGANASGKTNFMALFHKLKYFLKNSKKVSSKLKGYQPFALNNNEKNKSSLLEFEFLLNDDYIRYSLSFNSSTILSETLVFNKKMLYQNHNDEVVFNDSMLSEYVLNEVKDTIKRKKDVLILELLAIKECIPYIDIYNAFENSFMRFEPLESNKNLMEKLYNDKEQWSKISQWLQIADFGISRFEIERIKTPPEQQKLGKLVFETLRSIPELQIPENMIDDINQNSYEYVLKFYHKGEDGKEYPLESGVESRGTMMAFTMFVKLYSAFLHGGLLFDDEIDSSLHPLLIKTLIQAFNNPKINRGGAQLICTTHNSNLLKSDVLRRDEVWFIEKDVEGHSTVHPLSQFINVRQSIDFEKWYLQGRFGGIPLGFDIKDFEKLMEN